MSNLCDVVKFTSVHSKHASSNIAFTPTRDKTTHTGASETGVKCTLYAHADNAHDSHERFLRNATHTKALMRWCDGKKSKSHPHSDVEKTMMRPHRSTRVWILLQF